MAQIDLAEHRPNRRLLRRWDQVLVSLLHFLGLVAHPFVDEPLVDALGTAVAREAVPQDVPAAKLVPLAAGQDAFWVVAGFVAGDLHRSRRSFLLRATAPVWQKRYGPPGWFASHCVMPSAREGDKGINRDVRRPLDRFFP